MTASLSGVYSAQFFTDAGLPASNFRLYTYAPSTTTQKVAYTDEAQTVPHTYVSDGLGGLYIALNARGELPAPLMLTSGGYDISLKTPLGATVWTRRGRGLDDIAAALSVGLAASTGSILVGFLQAGAGAVAKTTQAKARERISVMDFGAVGDGVTNDSPAFALAWAYIKTRGGELHIPEGGVYLLNSQWILDVDQALPHNYKISGYGAQLLAGPAVTGHAVQVYRGYNNFGVKIEGLHFNHRGNTTVNGCIQGLNSANLRIVKCSMEAHNTKSTYAAIELAPSTPGDGNTNSFWTLIDGFTTRQRSGGDGTLAAVGIRLKGVANATKIKHCSLGGVVDAIRFDTDGVGVGLANGCAITQNDFEGITNGVFINTAAPCTAMPTGLKIKDNRAEAITNAFINVNGAAVLDASYPPILRDNYCTVGSVTNYLLNPNNQYVYVDEPSYFGVLANNKVGGPSNYTVVTDGIGHNFQVANLSGLSSWNGAHLVLGGFHLWVDGATGKLYIKGSAPTSATDGTVVGTQV